jgi:hypothetical protein
VTKAHKTVDRESPVQRAVVQYLRQVLPPECIVHFAKGEIKRGGKTFMIEQAKAKAMGAMPGFPDLVVLPYASAGGACFMEIKAEGNYASKSQKAMHEQLRALGYRVAVVRSVEDARECLREWGIGHREV